MEKLLSELASKVQALRFRVSKTDEVLDKNEREACERQKASILSISKIVIEQRESKRRNFRKAKPKNKSLNGAQLSSKTWLKLMIVYES